VQDKMDHGLAGTADRAVRPLPQVMLQVKADEFGRLYTPEAADMFARRALELQREHDSREANRYLLGKLGTELSTEPDEGYYGEALSYHLALLHAYSDQPERMAEYIARSKTMPGPRHNGVFSDHVTLSLLTREQQQAAIARKLPSFLFACMPQSAGGEVVDRLSDLLDIPTVHVTLGSFPQSFLAPAWLEMFMEGGAIASDAFPASDFNSGVLSNRGEFDVFVTIRDPRAAARDAARQAHGTGHASPEAIVSECVTKLVPWLQGWIALAQDPGIPFRVHWLRHTDIKRDARAVTERVCSILERSHPALGAFVTAHGGQPVTVVGTPDDDAWRSEVDDGLAAKMWAACTPELRQLLMLRS
jgi:hypothetical protein